MTCNVQAARQTVRNNPKNNTVKKSPSQPVLGNTPSLIVGRLEVISRSLPFLSRLWRRGSVFIVLHGVFLLYSLLCLVGGVQRSRDWVYIEIEGIIVSTSRG